MIANLVEVMPVKIPWPMTSQSFYFHLEPLQQNTITKVLIEDIVDSRLVDKAIKLVTSLFFGAYPRLLN